MVGWREAEPWIILQFYIDLLILDEFQGLAFVSKGEILGYANFLKLSLT